MPPAAYFFLACQKRGFSTPLSFPHGKESAVDGRKKGRQRGSCVGTNSTSLILSAACGGQASSVPLFLLFPHESLRWIRVGALAPLQTPLKRPRRGPRPPSLDFPRGLVCAEFVFRFTKRATDAFLLNWRGSRNTLRLFRVVLHGRPSVRDTRCSPCRKDGLSTSIRQIFNGRRQNDMYGLSCAWETRSDGRPKGVPCRERYR